MNYKITVKIKPIGKRFNRLAYTGFFTAEDFREAQFKACEYFSDLLKRKKSEIHVIDTVNQSIKKPS